MFVKPSIAPKLIPGPPAFDPNNTNVFKTGAPSSPTSAPTSNVPGTIFNNIQSLAFGANNNTPSASSSLSSIFSENVHKFKKFPDRAHWGLNNLMAYCTQNHISVVDPCSVQMITCLSGHHAVTTAVQWSSNAKTRGVERGNSTILASGDEAGIIIIWDVKKARKTCIFEEDGQSGKRAIISLRWLFNDDSIYLLSLSSGSVLSLWNVQNRNRVWRYEFSEPISSLSLDPFSNSSASFCSETGWIFVVSDLNPRNPPKAVEQKMRLESVKDKSGAITTSLRDFVYSPHRRNQMFLVSRRDITTFDMEIRQQITDKVIRGGRSEFRRLYTNEENSNLLYSLQEDGTIAAWEFSHEKNQFESVSCDLVRGSKHGADRPGLLYGLAFSPINPNKLCAVSADGKLWAWDYIREVDSDGAKKVRWVLTGLLETTSSTIASLQVSPFNNQLAVGTTNGTLLIFDLLSGAMTIKHDMFNMPVQGIRWFSESEILCFSSKKVSTKGFINELVAVDLRSGKHKPLRLDKKSDEAPIRAIRVSYSMKYLIVLAQDRPVEVYSLRTFSLIRLLPFTNITALEWCPNRILSKKKPTSDTSGTSDAPPSPTPSDPTKKKPQKEHFYFTTVDGSLHFYRVEEDKVFADTMKPKLFPYNQISALAWKNNMLVSGDSAGNITYLDLASKKSKSFATHRGLVRKILFSPENNNILVLFVEGDFAIWDLDQGAKIGSSPPYIKAACADWAPGNHPVIANNAGTVMIFDISLSTVNSSAIFNSLQEPITSPVFLPANHAQFLRSLMENNDLAGLGSFNVEPGIKITRNAFGEYVPDDCRDKPVKEQVLVHTQLLDEQLLKKLKDVNTSTAERCYLAAQFFGDRVAMQFWRMAKEYLTSYKKKNDELINAHGEQKIQETKHQAQLEQERAMQNEFSNMDTERSPVHLLGASSLDTFDPNARKNTLPAVYDLLRDSDSVLHDEMSILKIHDQTVRTKAAHGLFFKVGQNEAILNQKEQAVKLLVETPVTSNDSKDLYINYLHACVIAAANSTGDQQHFRQTVQVVASGLISRKTDNDIDFGVELLCLIGEGFKACKILQDFDKWEKAARLAKCILPDEQSRVILTRWADHLTSNNQLMKSIGIFMSLGLFKEVIDLLHKSELDDIGALFAKACLESGFDIPMLHKKTILRVTMPTALSSPSYSIAKNHDDYETTCRKLLYFIYQQYGTFLQRIGHEDLGQHYMYDLIKAEDCGIVKKEEQQQQLEQPPLDEQQHRDDTLDSPDHTISRPRDTQDVTQETTHHQQYAEDLLDFGSSTPHTEEGNLLDM